MKYSCLVRIQQYRDSKLYRYIDPTGPEPNVGMFIEDHKKRADSDPNAPPFDDLRNYAYEGGGSTAGSLSSLASGTLIVFIYYIHILLYLFTSIL